MRACVHSGLAWVALALAVIAVPASGQGPQRGPARPSREEFDALQRRVAALERRDYPGPGVPWRIGVQWRVVADAANFPWHAKTIGRDQGSEDSIAQRFRTWLSISPAPGIGGYLQLEAGHIVWGEDREGTKTFSVDGDSVGIELRRGYLQYESPAAGRFVIGIQDWHDAFGEAPSLGSFEAVDDYDSFGAVLANSVWDFNVGGVSWSKAFPAWRGLSLNAGVFQLWEGDPGRADDAYLFGLDADLGRPRDGATLGASLYYLVDRGDYSYPTAAPYESSWDLWFGLRASGRPGGFPLRGWLILNRGERTDLGGGGFDHTGWAAKLEAFGVSLGAGQFSAQVLYASGDDDPTDGDSREFRTIAQSERDGFGAQGYWSYLALTSPHGPSDVKDLGVGLQNRGLGLFTVQAKYGYPIAGRLHGTTAAGWLQAAEANPSSGARGMGLELAHTFSLDLGSGLTVDFGAAYLFTGSFYRAAGGPPPEGLWELFARMQLEL